MGADDIAGVLQIRRGLHMAIRIFGSRTKVIVARVFCGNEASKVERLILAMMAQSSEREVSTQAFNARRLQTWPENSFAA